MPPKRKTSDTGDNQRKRKVMPLEEKVKVCDRLREGQSAAAVARMFGVNESTE